MGEPKLLEESTTVTYSTPSLSPAVEAADSAAVKSKEPEDCTMDSSFIIQQPSDSGLNTSDEPPSMKLTVSKSPPPPSDISSGDANSDAQLSLSEQSSVGGSSSKGPKNKEKEEELVLYQDDAISIYDAILKKKRFDSGVDLSTTCLIFKTAWELPEQRGRILPGRILRHFKTVLPKKKKKKKSKKKKSSETKPKTTLKSAISMGPTIGASSKNDSSKGTKSAKLGKRSTVGFTTLNSHAHLSRPGGKHVSSKSGGASSLTPVLSLASLKESDGTSSSFVGPTAVSDGESSSLLSITVTTDGSKAPTSTAKAAKPEKVLISDLKTATFVKSSADDIKRVVVGSAGVGPSAKTATPLLSAHLSGTTTADDSPASPASRSRSDSRRRLLPLDSGHRSDSMKRLGQDKAMDETVTLPIEVYKADGTQVAVSMAVTTVSANSGDESTSDTESKAKSAGSGTPGVGFPSVNITRSGRSSLAKRPSQVTQSELRKAKQELRAAKPRANKAGDPASSDALTEGDEFSSSGEGPDSGEVLHLERKRSSLIREASVSGITFPVFAPTAASVVKVDSAVKGSGSSSRPGTPDIRGHSPKKSSPRADFVFTPEDSSVPVSMVDPENSSHLDVNGASLIHEASPQPVMGAAMSVVDIVSLARVAAAAAEKASEIRARQSERKKKAKAKAVAAEEERSAKSERSKEDEIQVHPVTIEPVSGDEGYDAEESTDTELEHFQPRISQRPPRVTIRRSVTTFDESARAAQSALIDRSGGVSNFGMFSPKARGLTDAFQRFQDVHERVEEATGSRTSIPRSSQAKPVRAPGIVVPILSGARVGFVEQMEEQIHGDNFDYDTQEFDEMMMVEETGGLLGLDDEDEGMLAARKRGRKWLERCHSDSEMSFLVESNVFHFSPKEMIDQWKREREEDKARVTSSSSSSEADEPSAPSMRSKRAKSVRGGNRVQWQDSARPSSSKSRPATPSYHSDGRPLRKSRKKKSHMGDGSKSKRGTRKRNERRFMDSTGHIVTVTVDPRSKKVKRRKLYALRQLGYSEILDDIVVDSDSDGDSAAPPVRRDITPEPGIVDSSSEHNSRVSMSMVVTFHDVGTTAGTDTAASSDESGREWKALPSTVPKIKYKSESITSLASIASTASDASPDGGSESGGIPKTPASKGTFRDDPSLPMFALEDERERPSRSPHRVDVVTPYDEMDEPSQGVTHQKSEPDPSANTSLAPAPEKKAATVEDHSVSEGTLVKAADEPKAMSLSIVSESVEHNPGDSGFPDMSSQILKPSAMNGNNSRKRKRKVKVKKKKTKKKKKSLPPYSETGILYYEDAKAIFEHFSNKQRYQKGLGLDKVCATMKTAWELPEQNGVILSSRVVRHYKQVLPSKKHALAVLEKERKLEEKRRKEKEAEELESLKAKAKRALRRKQSSSDILIRPSMTVKTGEVMAKKTENKGGDSGDSPAGSSDRGTPVGKSKDDVQIDTERSDRRTRLPKQRPRSKSMRTHVMFGVGAGQNLLKSTTSMGSVMMAEKKPEEDLKAILSRLSQNDETLKESPRVEDMPRIDVSQDDEDEPPGLARALTVKSPASETAEAAKEKRKSHFRTQTETLSGTLSGRRGLYLPIQEPIVSLKRSTRELSIARLDDILDASVDGKSLKREIKAHSSDDTGTRRAALSVASSVASDETGPAPSPRRHQPTIVSSELDVHRNMYGVSPLIESADEMDDDSPWIKRGVASPSEFVLTLVPKQPSHSRGSLSPATPVPTGIGSPRDKAAEAEKRRRAQEILIQRKKEQLKKWDSLIEKDQYRGGNDGMLEDSTHAPSPGVSSADGKTGGVQKSGARMTMPIGKSSTMRASTMADFDDLMGGMQDDYDEEHEDSVSMSMSYYEFELSVSRSVRFTDTREDSLSLSGHTGHRRRASKPSKSGSTSLKSGQFLDIGGRTIGEDEEDDDLDNLLLSPSEL